MLAEQVVFKMREDQAASSAAGRPAPVILTKEQQAAKRAALLNRLAALPDHLRLWAWRCPVCASC